MKGLTNSLIHHWPANPALTTAGAKVVLPIPDVVATGALTANIKNSLDNSPGATAKSTMRFRGLIELFYKLQAYKT